MNTAIDARKRSFSKAHIETVSYRPFESVPTGPTALNRCKMGRLATILPPSPADWAIIREIRHKRETETNVQRGDDQCRYAFLLEWAGWPHIWVVRQAHTDVTLAPVTDALVNFAAPRAGETVLDVGCGCGAPTLEFARVVGPSGHVVGMDISGPMLAEAAARAKAAGIANVDWRQDDPAKAKLEGFDLLVSAFGVMFFGDMVEAFTNMRRAAKPGARLALVCWRGLAENPWMAVPMNAVAQHLPPRPKGTQNAPGMFAFADPEYVSQVLTDAGWAAPRFEKFDHDLDIAADRGLEEAVVQSTQIGAVNSWLRNQPAEIISAYTQSLREALAPHADGGSVRLPGAMWLIGSVAS